MIQARDPHETLPQPSPPTPPSPNEATKPPATVVIADDALHIRRTLHALLHDSRHFQVVAEAADGAQAIEQCRRLRPDVLLLDLSMPNVDGFQALAAVRTTSPHTKVIVISGQEPTKHRRRALRLGATGYIDKSTEIFAIWNEILTILTKPVATHGPTPSLT